MIRGFIKLVLLVVVVVVAAGFLMGWWGNSRVLPAGTADGVANRAAQAADKTGDAAKVVGDRAAKGAEAARRAISEGSLTAKIKAKMALDDHVKALDLNVDTVGTVVTVTGVVNTDAERERALALARDTEGVTQVIDRIKKKQ